MPMPVVATAPVGAYIYAKRGSNFLRTHERDISRPFDYSIYENDQRNARAKRHVQPSIVPYRFCHVDAAESDLAISLSLYPSLIDINCQLRSKKNFGHFTHLLHEFNVLLNCWHNSISHMRD